jgi:hypothetical protein
MVWIPSRRCYGMIHKMLMAAAGSGGATDTSYYITNIAYSGTATPNVQSIEAQRDTRVGGSKILYNFDFFNNGQGIITSSGANSDFCAYTVEFGGGAYTKGTELFDSSTSVSMPTNDRCDFLTFIDSTNLVGAYGNTLKKFTCSTSWDISTISNQTYNTSSFAGPPFSGLIKYFKFNSTGTEIIIVTPGSSPAGLFKFTLSTPYDIATISSSPTQSDTTHARGVVHINDAGTVITYQNGGQDWNYRQQTMSTPFDLSTLSTETVYTFNFSDGYGTQYNEGLGFAEAHGSFAAGEVFFFNKSPNVIGRGVCSTAYDLSTITWDTDIPSGSKATLITQASGNADIASTNRMWYLENYPDNFNRNGQFYVGFDRYPGQGDKWVWQLSAPYTIENLSVYGDGSAINLTNTAKQRRTFCRTRTNYYAFISSEYINNAYAFYLDYVPQVFGGGIDSTNAVDYGSTTTVDITSWISDGGLNLNTIYPKRIQMRQEHEYTNGLNEYRCWVLLATQSTSVTPQIDIIRQMTATSNPQSSPTIWSLDTGANATWQIPRGGTYEPATDEYISDFQVSHDGRYILICTWAGKLYLFENDNPWNLNGNITAIQEATIPLAGNKRPEQIHFNSDGTKLFVHDFSAIIFEYDIGT